MSYIQKPRKDKFLLRKKKRKKYIVMLVVSYITNSRRNMNFQLLEKITRHSTTKILCDS